MNKPQNVRERGLVSRTNDAALVTKKLKDYRRAVWKTAHKDVPASAASPLRAIVR